MSTQAIKLNIYQETANYRVPVSFGFRESYPLPAYSTVIGMIHSLCDFHEYHPMKISVQGSYASTTFDLFTRYEFNKGQKWSESRNQLNVGGFGVTRGVGNVQLLVDVNLTIHIVPDNQDDLDIIYHALRHPREFVSLGRREDIAKVNTKLVTLDTKMLDQDYTVKQSVYLPRMQINDDFSFDTENDTGQRGTFYDLNKNYDLVQTRNKYFERKWHKVQALYVSDFTLLCDGEFVFDSENEPVFLA